MYTKIKYSWPNFKIGPEWSLFLDRDGVINNRLPGDYVKKWEEFSFLPNVLESIPIFNTFFRRIFIVTNQAGIEKELMTHQDLTSIHENMMSYIEYHGGHIDEIYYCPYKGDLDPLCRKPNPGMAIEAKNDFPEIDFEKCVMIGDSESDIVFGNRLKMKTILVGPNASALINSGEGIPDAKLDCLWDYAQWLRGNR
jgi:D-glycero-D-manno-heptose 1,7-bisphosphate phosphatase